MKKTVIGVIIISLVVGGALVAALVFRPLTPVTPTTVTPSQPADDAEQAVTTLSPGRYETYSALLIDDEGYDETILFFHAGWCPECRAFEQAIQSEALPDGVQILKIDYDTSQELRQKYDITLQSTFVKVADDGQEISKWVGYGRDKSVNTILENT